MTRCPLCSRDLVPHGTGGLVCAKGHSFLAETSSTPVHAAGREFEMPPWVPGAVLGGLALVLSILEAVGVL